MITKTCLRFTGKLMFQCVASQKEIRSLLFISCCLLKSHQIWFASSAKNSICSHSHPKRNAVTLCDTKEKWTMKSSVVNMVQQKECVIFDTPPSSLWRNGYKHGNTRKSQQWMNTFSCTDRGLEEQTGIQLKPLMWRWGRWGTKKQQSKGMDGWMD